MSETELGTDAIVHVALVVTDVETTVARYARVFGKIPPPIRVTGGMAGTVTFRGEPTEGRAKLAVFKLGQIALEIIEPVGGPSVWQEYLEQHGPGIHHMGLIVPDMKRALAYLEAEEQPVLQHAAFHGGRYAYVGTEKTLGVMLELLELD